MRRGTRRLLQSAGLHLGLLAGSVLFAFPFVWLVTTTFKADEEIFSERVNWIPKLPLYSRSSPYIDQRAYGPMRPPTRLVGNEWSLLQPALKDLLWRRAREVAPSGLKLPAEAEEQMARGLWDQMRDTLPGPLRLRDGTAAAAVDKAVTTEAVATVWTTVNRQLAIGKLRLLDERNQDLAAGARVSWQVTGGEMAERVSRLDGEMGRVITYHDQPRGWLTLRCQVRGRTEGTQRIALGFHDDRSWRHVDVLLVNSRGTLGRQRPSPWATASGRT